MCFETDRFVHVNFAGDNRHLLIKTRLKIQINFRSKHITKDKALLDGKLFDKLFRKVTKNKLVCGIVYRVS